MNLIDRIKSRNTQTYRGGQIEHKRSSFLLWPEWHNDKPYAWRATAVRKYAEEGFSANALIYSAIMFKARAQMGAPLRAYTGSYQQPELLPPDHPLAQLIARPNSHQSWVEFHALNTVYFNLAGNAFIWLDRPNRTALPTRMLSLRPDRVYAIPSRKNKREIIGYLFVPEGSAVKDGIPMLPEDVMNPKLPNPLDPFEGMGPGLSPLACLAEAADVDNSITRYLKMFFERGTMVSGILKFDTPLEPDDVAEIKERWRQQHGGIENWTEIGVLDQGGDYQRVGMTLNEMNFAEIDRRNEARLTMPFGVNGILLGTEFGKERSIQANLKIAEEQFWRGTFKPEMTLFEEEFRYYLQSDDAFVKFDYSAIPALKQIENWPIWVQMVRSGIPKAMAASLLGLDLPALEDGDVIYMTPDMIPVGAQQPVAEQTEDGAPEATEDAGAKSMPPFLKK